MIHLPTTLCKCDTVYEQAAGLSKIVPLALCGINQCDVDEPKVPVPLPRALCLCDPEPEIVVNLTPEPRKRTKVVKTCFTEFITNITSTKFCKVGPTCKVS